jgi:hypothetical protein
MTKRFLFTFAAALFAIAGLASAAPPPITQTKTFSGIPSMSGPFTFNQFNTGLGTLTSIQVQLNLQTSGGELKLDNDSHQSASGTFEFGAQGTINSTDVSLLNSSFLSIPGTANAYHSGSFSLDPNVGDGPGDYSPLAPDGMLYTGTTENDNKSGYVGSAVWAAGIKGFLGTGTYNINYSITQWLDYGGIGGIEYAVTPVSASGDVTVVYNYIPEPATIALLTIGALALLKRKNSK